MSGHERDVWTDYLLEKHECSFYGPASTKTKRIDVDGAGVTLVTPAWLPDIEVVTVTREGELCLSSAASPPQRSGALTETE